MRRQVLRYFDNIPLTVSSGSSLSLLSHKEVHCPSDVIELETIPIYAFYAIHAMAKDRIADVCTCLLMRPEVCTSLKMKLGY